MHCGFFLTPTSAEKGNLKAPRKESKRTLSFKNALSEGNRANVGTGKEMAGEPALRSPSHLVHPHCMSEGDCHAQQPSPHFHYSACTPDSRCAHSPQPQIILTFLPPRSPSCSSSRPSPPRLVHHHLQTVALDNLSSSPHTPPNRRACSLCVMQPGSLHPLTS